MDERMDSQTDRGTRQTDAQILPVFYRTSLPSGLLPCLLNHCHCNVDRLITVVAGIVVVIAILQVKYK